MSSYQTDFTSSASIASYKKIEWHAKGIEFSEAKLESHAVQVIKAFAFDNQSTFSPDKKKKHHIKLDQILTAMLAHAMEIGGESSKHYVLSCIAACEEPGRQKFSLLRDLSITWLTHFLFPFKTPIRHSDATDVLIKGDFWEEMAVSFLGSDKITSAFRENLLVRDGRKCLISGRKDLSIGGGFVLESTHFLRKSVANLKDQKSPHYESALMTLDILQRYTCLPDNILNDHIDDTSNGMIIDANLHAAFDRFFWCLKPTEMENVYKITQVDENRTDFWDSIPKGLDRLHDPVVFKNESGKFTESSSSDGVFALPNPTFIRIHAAIAGILHMSGAGSFFDELLFCFGEGEDYDDPVRCWTEFESIIENGEIQDLVLSLADM